MSSAIIAPMSSTDGLSAPWSAPTAEQARRFGAHLQREIGPRHVLYGRAVTAIAARADADDVVFALGDGSGVALASIWAAGPDPEVCGPGLAGASAFAATSE